MKLLLLATLIFLCSSCDLFKDSPNGEQHEKALDQEVLESFKDYGTMFFLADVFRVSKNEFENACRSEKELSPYCDEITEAIKNGVCHHVTDVRDTLSFFRVTTLNNTAKPKDEQKKCPLYLDAMAEKTIPTAGKNLWERKVDLRYHGEKDSGKSARNLQYTISTPTDPKTTNPVSFDLKGSMNTQNITLSGKGSFSQSTTPTTFDFSGEITAKRGTSEAKIKIKSLVSINPLSITDAKYEIDGKDVSPSLSKLTEMAFHLMFLWGWPNEGPRT